MAQKTDAQLTTDANVIRDETAEGGNTRARVSSHTKDIVDSKINNDQVDTANTLDTSSKTIPGRDAVKSYIAAAIAAINPLFLGLYTSLSALETAYPTADSGQYAIVDPGSGTDAVKYIWDEDEGWVAGSSGPGSNLWADLVGDPSDNTAFNTYISDLLTGINADFATKSDSLYTIRTTTGGHTLDATDLAAINAGDLYIIENSGGGDLTIPTNATQAFSNGTGMGIRGFANIVAAGGVTATPDSGSLALPAATVSIEKKATNTWLIHNGAPSVAASDTQSGVVELATSAETLTGTDTTRATTPAGVKAVADTKLAHTNSAGSLTDGATIDLTATKHTLATSSAARTFTISYAGDDITMEVTLSATSSTFTFPASSLCVSEGIASGDNTLALSGVSGDKYIISVKKIGSAYYVVSKNFGQ